MRNLLERAIVHLLNGDEDKAATLFHKFMVERARQIHESLRVNEGEDSLDGNWDSEIKEEEYFGDDDLGDEDGSTMHDHAAPVGDDMGDESAPAPADAMDDSAMDDPAMDDESMGDDVVGDDDGLGDDAIGDDMDGEPGVEGKIDDLSDKIDELTAQFDKIMSEFGDEDDMGGDDAGLDDMGGDDSSMDADDDAVPGDNFDAGSDDVSDEAPEGGSELADRMEDDMADDDVDADDHHMAEGKLPDFIKKKQGKKVDEEDDEDGDDDLSDITESVLAELEKVAAPGNTEHKGVGSNSVKSNITVGPKDSPMPRHNVMDRIKGEPVMTKGPTHKGYAKEESPPVKSADTLVKNVRPGNRRKSYKDTMDQVADSKNQSALIHKDFAGGPKSTRSLVDGKSKKG